MGLDPLSCSILQQTTTYLQQNIIPTAGLWGGLTQRNVLSQDMVEKIKYNATDEEQINRLLALLPKRGSTTFDDFCKTLRECQHEHVAVHLESLKVYNYVYSITIRNTSTSKSLLVEHMSDLSYPPNLPAKEECKKLKQDNSYIHTCLASGVTAYLHISTEVVQVCQTAGKYDVPLEEICQKLNTVALEIRGSNNETVLAIWQNLNTLLGCLVAKPNTGARGNGLHGAERNTGTQTEGRNGSDSDKYSDSCYQVQVERGKIDKLRQSVTSALVTYCDKIEEGVEALKKKLKKIKNIPKGKPPRPGLRVLRKELASLRGQYDEALAEHKFRLGGILQKVYNLDDRGDELDPNEAKIRGMLYRIATAPGLCAQRRGRKIRPGTSRTKRTPAICRSKPKRATTATRPPNPRCTSARRPIPPQAERSRSPQVKSSSVSISDPGNTTEPVGRCLHSSILPNPLEDNGSNTISMDFQEPSANSKRRLESGCSPSSHVSTEKSSHTPAADDEDTPDIGTVRWGQVFSHEEDIRNVPRDRAWLVQASPTPRHHDLSMRRRPQDASDPIDVNIGSPQASTTTPEERESCPTRGIISENIIASRSFPGSLSDRHFDENISVHRDANGNGANGNANVTDTYGEALLRPTSVTPRTHDLTLPRTQVSWDVGVSSTSIDRDDDPDRPNSDLCDKTNSANQREDTVLMAQVTPRRHKLSLSRSLSTPLNAWQ